MYFLLSFIGRFSRVPYLIFGGESVVSRPATPPLPTRRCYPTATKHKKNKEDYPFLIKIIHAILSLFDR